MPSCFKSVHIILEPKQNYRNTIFSVYLANTYFQFSFYFIVYICLCVHICTDVGTHGGQKMASNYLEEGCQPPYIGTGPEIIQKHNKCSLEFSCLSSPIVLLLLFLILLLLVLLLFSSECNTVSHCHFNVYFSNDNIQCSTYFYVFLSVFIFFYKNVYAYLLHMFSWVVFLTLHYESFKTYVSTKVLSWIMVRG